METLSSSSLSNFFTKILQSSLSFDWFVRSNISLNRSSPLVEPVEDPNNRCQTWPRMESGILLLRQINRRSCRLHCSSSAPSRAKILWKKKFKSCYLFFNYNGEKINNYQEPSSVSKSSAIAPVKFSAVVCFVSYFIQAPPLRLCPFTISLINIVASIRVIEFMLNQFFYLSVTYA